MLQWLTSHQILMTDPVRLHDCNAEVKPVLYCFTYAALTHSTRQPMVVSMIKSSSGLECTKLRREKESEHARKEMTNISLLKQQIWTVEKKHWNRNWQDKKTHWRDILTALCVFISHDITLVWQMVWALSLPCALLHYAESCGGPQVISGFECLRLSTTSFFPYHL